jgi:hypothetical protein
VLTIFHEVLEAIPVLLDTVNRVRHYCARYEARGET